MELKDVTEDDTIKCEDCQKNFHGWAIIDNNGDCPSCQRNLV